MCRVVVISPNRRILQNAEIIESPVVRGANPDTIIYLRRLHQEYSLINNSGEKKRIWSAHARSVSLRCNVELRVLCILMRESHYDRTIPEDEVIIQLSFRVLLRSSITIRRHTQYYIIMQLLYGLRRIAIFDSERIREKLEMDWTLNVLTILTYLDFDFDTSRFILHRIRTQV
ncbi:unnamed protein product [Macrosiphum euphorbiae]|uniref:Uncharacterized protein n=1 Tax=Macrosiphum euphorbiae TaxID=13131 RepID=A0AAV0WDB9_9HEMI|nr:unnamed protein product [Macrosiphum euphorbiae]CAI6367469.1 unnamed protein product [Macrosiphum euphorbiae]